MEALMQCPNCQTDVTLKQSAVNVPYMAETYVGSCTGCGALVTARISAK